MNAIKRAEDIHYLAYPELNFHKLDIADKNRLNSIKQHVIKEFCMDFRAKFYI